ncbi:Long-chain-fatty-acid--CoA ligase [compost metagenome]
MERIAHAFHACTGVYLMQEYGLSEGGIVSLNDNPLKPEAVGRPIPGVKITIVGEAGTPTQHDMIGEIHVDRAYAPTQYWQQSYAAKKSIITAYGIPTGDLGWVDADGYLYIAQRKKWMINVAGNKVDPTEVEEALMLSEWLEECLVLPRKDEWRGEVVQAYVVVRTSKAITENDLIEYCRRHLSSYKVPKIIQFVDKLIRSDSGKIRRSHYFSNMR